MREKGMCGTVQTARPSKSMGESPYPLNCSHPCCYGYSRPFCFPCMRKLLEEREKNKKER